MHRVYSNGPERDYVINPLERLIAKSSELHFAAPFFDAAEPVLEAAAEGKPVRLLIGLNEATTPTAVKQVVAVPNVTARYLTDRFHAKIYLGDAAALVGSANLTNAGLKGNREAVVTLDRPEDGDALDEVRQIFLGLWDSAAGLNAAVALDFERIWLATRPQGKSRDELIAEAVGPAAAHSVVVGSGQKSRERLFVDQLQRRLGEQYAPAFREVSAFLAGGFRRPSLSDLSLSNETNRFLNWIRLVRAAGPDAWRSPRLSTAARREVLAREASAWQATDEDEVTSVYRDWLRTVEDVFGDRDRLAAASQADHSRGLGSLHAFMSQNRHVERGDVVGNFWKLNTNDADRVRRALLHLIHGPGDFVDRLHDFLHDPAHRIRRIGIYTALELQGTVKPDQCPPVNSRIAKGLRYLGHEVVTD